MAISNCPWLLWRRIPLPADLPGGRPVWLLARTPTGRAVDLHVVDNGWNAVLKSSRAGADSAKLLRLGPDIRRLDADTGIAVYQLPAYLGVAHSLLLQVRRLRSPQHISVALATALRLVRQGAWGELARRLRLRAGSEHLQLSPRPGKSRPVYRRRYAGPIRLAVVSHDLGREGAPISVFELSRGLRDSGIATPSVLALCGGPLEDDYRAAGLPLEILEIRPAVTPTDLSAAAADLQQAFRNVGAEAVIANTARSLPAVLAAARSDLPCAWIIRESGGVAQAFGEAGLASLPLIEQALADVDAAIFVAAATRERWQAYMRHDATMLIPNALDRPAQVGEQERVILRANLSLQAGDIMLLTVGTLSERKRQADIVAAFGRLPLDIARSCHLVLVGASDPGYNRIFRQVVDRLPGASRSRLHLVGPVGDPSPYFAAADAFVFSSQGESHPRVILEALNAGLPIVTTPVDGIADQVIDGESAIFFAPGRVDELVGILTKLCRDASLRDRLSAGARRAACSNDFDRMLQAYAKVLQNFYVE
jgi:hypothetical protein